MRINRSNVILEQLLGDGQFGNVYRGSYTKNVNMNFKINI